MENNRELFGIGYIILPEGVDRKDFVETCFNKEQFSICTNNGEIIINVPASSQTLNELIIPNTSSELGTQVCFINEEKHNKPFIIGTFSKQKISEFRKENDLKFQKGSIGLNGNSVFSKLVIFARATKNKLANLSLEVSGNEDSSLNLKSSGWIVNQSKKGIKLKNNNREVIIDENKFLYADGIHQLNIDDNGFTYKDGQNNINIGSKSISINTNQNVDLTCELANIISDNIRLGGNKSIILTNLPPGSAITSLDTIFASSTITGK